nr:unnamed protein product [Callosobruchus analis]
MKWREFDYHIQTNNIPAALTNPIKQIGEKCPIHTIAAPNLSLKVRPIVVHEVQQEMQQQKLSQQQQQQQKYREQYQPACDPLQQKIQQQLLQEQQFTQHYRQNGADIQQQQQGQHQEQASNQGGIYLQSNLSPKELYQLPGAAYPQAVVAQSTQQKPDTIKQYYLNSFLSLNTSL